MKYSQRMVFALAALLSLLSIAAARSLDVSGSRQLLQEGACPPQMTECFTTPYQAQYFCCDSSANLECSGGPDFMCINLLEDGLPQVPASLIPGQSTPSPTAASTSSPTSGPTLLTSAINPSNTATNSPTSGPSTEVQSTTPPQTNPPAPNPPETSPPAPLLNSSNTGGGFRTGIATWYTDPNNADYYQSQCFYNHPEQNPPGRYIVALPPHIYGAGPGAGNGPGCDTFWEIKCVGTVKRVADGLYGGNGAAACRTGQSIIVKGGDLCAECDEPRNDICTSNDSPYCPPPNGYTPGQPGEHLELALPAWQKIGNNPGLAGVITIQFRQVSRVPDSQLGVPF